MSCSDWLAEIPLFHVLNARITFGNIFGVDEKAPGVHMEMPEDVEAGAVLPTDCCVVDESCFEAPASYSVVGKCLGAEVGNAIIVILFLS